MADTANTPTAQDSPTSRQIRVFLSSTFRDFMEERDLLVKQVFPSLRRRAQERGVEVVDVDLRWGVTQEESEQGKVIGICLAEIERCRPYFIGMLGERYGWTPGKTDYPDELFEREQLGWIRDHQGDASVTELEILHGVLNDKEMAGRAFFYFRDPAWSRAQSELGFVCETAAEEAKLAALKDRIRASGFPVEEDLPDPKAIADQIEADLWALIEEQYTDLDEADALEREARKHASYRQSRLGVYLGQQHIDQLEGLLGGGESKILITGESGSGKSALIANWMHQHEREYPDDVVYAHHLGCSNDANAIRPLLGRMLETASSLLKDAELITETIQVPQDWWELTAKVAETLQDLGRWCRKTGKPWIWVLDGLDRLAEDDQQALPWLPLLIPEGVSVVISALECPARAILLEREFQLLEIGPLNRNEQEQLIETYLERYTKKLDADRVEQILACELARSPLFLHVLLEELRQCGRFETLESQIADYIRPLADGSLTVNDLYDRVLERLERDFGHDPVRMALTSLWASRAGLSESELLAITGLAPLQLAPIDLALAQAFGRNGNRLVFDHEFLRIAVQDRYLPTAEKQQAAHSELADWFSAQKRWDARKAEELPWQLKKSNRVQDLRSLLLNINDLYALATETGSREVINYWLTTKDQGDGDLDELIVEALDVKMNEQGRDVEDKILFVDTIAALLEEAGLYRELLLSLRIKSLEITEASHSREPAAEARNKEVILEKMLKLAQTHKNCGSIDIAVDLCIKCCEDQRSTHGTSDLREIATYNLLGTLHVIKGDYTLAVDAFEACLGVRKRILGEDHPSTLICMNNLAASYQYSNNLKAAEDLYIECLARRERVLGVNHLDTLKSVFNLGTLYSSQGEYEEALNLVGRSLVGHTRVLGEKHPDRLKALYTLGALHCEVNNLAEAESCYSEAVTGYEQCLGIEHHETVTCYHNLGTLYADKQEYTQAAKFLEKALDGHLKIFGTDHPFTNLSRFSLARLYTCQARYSEAIPLRRDELAWCRRLKGSSSSDALYSVIALANDLRKADELQEAEALYREFIYESQQVLEPSEAEIGDSAQGLAVILEQTGRTEESLIFIRQALTHRLRFKGMDSYEANIARQDAARILYKLGQFDEALKILGQLEDSIINQENYDNSHRAILEEAKVLRDTMQI